MTGVLTATGGGYAHDGWKQWPQDEEFSSQFVRILAASQDGGSTIGECFQTAGRITPGDRESWHQAWLTPAERHVARAEAAEAAGHRVTARASWIRASNYFRTAEFFLDPCDARRLPTFDRIEACSHRALALFDQPGEIVRIPFGETWLDAYFLPAPRSKCRPCIIAFGGLDEFKDELIQEMERQALSRNLSLLLVDLPGQGGSLRRRELVARPDSEASVAACIDWLLTREDVDRDRIGLYGASLGAYYALRAAAHERRVCCAVSDGAQWKLKASAELMRSVPNSHLVRLACWVFGARDVEHLVRISEPFDLEGVIARITCPLLIVSGELDAFGNDNARKVHAEAERAGVQVDIRWISPEETGAAHCQIDNPTLAMEFICDWFAQRLAK
jgi:pimeloyl-ACP methyl ester carboxylesterase